MPLREERPTAAEIQELDAYKSITYNLIPDSQGILPVAANRGGPINISWEVHGHGPIKLVWVMGLGTIKSAWQKQTLKYGHEQGNKYSSLIFDNRGMGQSDKPTMRYSTSEMAKDTIEVLDHIGWNEERQLNLVGVSMGGMIELEIAKIIPTRIQSMALISTAARIENTTSFMANMQSRIRMFIPKTLDESVSGAADLLFTEEWLAFPDDTVLPSLDTPGVSPPDNGGEYKHFRTMYERWASQEISKRLNTSSFGRKGFMLQAIAAGWHHVSKEQLKEIGDSVGRERILVMHGMEDKMITSHHGRVLIDELQPGIGILKPGVGHVFMLEDSDFHNATVEALWAKAAALKQ